eukprot:6100009-Amphidinium_carterae.1
MALSLAVPHEVGARSHCSQGLKWRANPSVAENTLANKHFGSLNSSNRCTVVDRGRSCLPNAP